MPAPSLSPRKALIAGGGIGGLTAALCLHNFGWQVEVLEKAPAPADVGAGIQLGPNAMKVYQALGLDAALADIGFTPEAIQLRMGKTGRRLLRARLGDTAHKRWGAPYLHIHRADLITVLQTALIERAPAALTYGTCLKGYQQNEQTINATLEDGTHRTGDILIGADGIHSAVRTQMLGPDAPVFTGNVAWRAIVPVERLGHQAPDPVACAWMGRGKHAVTYLLRGGKLANLVGVIERDDWTSERWTEIGRRKEAAEDFKGWHPKVTRLIEQADSLYRWALFDRPPLERWHEGRALLLGDAAHPMLPFMAQGAAMAIEDAWALAASLSKCPDIQSAFTLYRHKRFERTSDIQAASRANAKTFHQRTWRGQVSTYGPMWLAGRLAPALGLKRQDWVYGYDVIKDMVT